MVKCTRVAGIVQPFYQKVVRFIHDRRVQIVFTGFAFVFAGGYLYRNWERYRVSLVWDQIKPPLLLLSTLLVWLIVLSGSLTWYFLLRGLGFSIKVNFAVQTHLYSNVVKYLPGGIWQYVFKYISFNPKEFNWTTPAKAITVEFILVILTGVFNTLIFYPIRMPTVNGIGWMGMILLGISPFILAKIPFKALDLRLSPLFLLGGIGLLFLNWNLLGVALWLMDRSMGVGSFSVLPAYIFSFCSAVVGGILFLPVPQGAGIRETIMLYLLEQYAHTPHALILAGISRLQIILGEFVLAGTLWIIRKIHE